MKQKLMAICQYLKTSTEGKKHGSYWVYEEPEKIRITYDTYYPNVSVRVWVDGNWKTAALYSGHGWTQEFHSGAWEKYVEDVIYPRVADAKAESERRKREKDEEERRKKFGSLNDSATFT